MTTLYTEQSVSKNPVDLILTVDTKSINGTIDGMRETLKNCEDPEGEIDHYTYSHHDPKTREEVVTEMASDIEMFVKCSQGLIRQTPKEEIINKMKAEIAGIEYQPINWANHFHKIPKKKDGTFAIGRVVTIAAAHGFSWEDEEAYGRKGPEMVIKTFSATEAQLIIRTGVIEKW